MKVMNRCVTDLCTKFGIKDILRAVNTAHNKESEVKKP